MADFSGSKAGIGDLYPNNQTDGDWVDLEPLINPQDLKDIHLFGIPLVSNIRDPLTNRITVMDDPKIKRFILEAVGLAELEAKIDIFPHHYNEKQAFDRVAYEAFGYMTMRHRPIYSLESLLVMPANEQAVFSVPLEWVDVGYLHEGQISLIPLTIALKTGSMVPLTTSPGGATFLSIWGNRTWIASFWQVVYTTGFYGGLVPKVINQFIGTIAAMEILSAIGATYARSNSTSLGIDGLSQSISTPGSEIFQVRLKELADKRKWLKSRIQTAFGMNFISDNV